MRRLAALIIVPIVLALFAHPATAATPDAAGVAAATARARPVRLAIKTITLDRPVLSVGLDKRRIPVVPNHDIGWYNLSAGPGEGENIVFWGHVLRFRTAPKKPAPFARLKELEPGAVITLTDQTGKKYRYVVTDQIWATPDQVQYILPQGKEMLTLVSCIGDKVIVGKEVVEMTNRLITIAVPETP